MDMHTRYTWMDAMLIYLKQSQKLKQRTIAQAMCSGQRTYVEVDPQLR